MFSLGWRLHVFFVDGPTSRGNNSFHVHAMATMDGIAIWRTGSRIHKHAVVELCDGCSEWEVECLLQEV